MKKCIAVLVILSLLPITALAQTDSGGLMTIIGGAVGTVVEGPNVRSNLSSAFGGIRVARVSKTANLFGALQVENVAVPNVNGWGGRILLQNEFTACPDLSILLDVGWLSKIAQNGDSTRTAGIKIGGGLAYQVGDILGIFVYADAHDAGPNFSWGIYTGIYGLNLQSLIPGL